MITDMHYHIAGYSLVKSKHVLYNGDNKVIKLPCLVAEFIHPKYGCFFIDTGMECLEDQKGFPYNIYKRVTPFLINENFRLIDHSSAGLLLTHAHPDHIGGINKFSFQNKPEIWSHPVVGLNIPGKGSKTLLNRMFFKGLGCDTHNIRTLPKVVIPDLYPFSEGYDIFMDKSVFAVELPGHDQEQVGYYFPYTDNGSIFIVADAVWNTEDMLNGVFPSSIVTFLTGNPKTYKETYRKLVLLSKNRKDINFVASHDMKLTKEK